jgi:uncharacterized protein (TIGR02001 family)
VHESLSRAGLSILIAASQMTASGIQGAEPSGGELSANLSLVSNYYFRGVSQTDDGPAVQGGVDYEWIGGTGFYVGTWLSNVDFGDGTGYGVYLYGGWALWSEDLDVGYVYYAFPDNPGDGYDYGELYVDTAWKWITMGLAYTTNSDVDEGAFKTGDIYGYVGFDLEREDGWGFGGHVGGYDFDDHGQAGQELTYVDWSAHIRKDTGSFGEFRLTYVQTDISRNNAAFGTDSSGDPKFWVGWTKRF